jgi:hypothetical protein
LLIIQEITQINSNWSMTNLLLLEIIMKYQEVSLESEIVIIQLH